MTTRRRKDVVQEVERERDRQTGLGGFFLKAWVLVDGKRYRAHGYVTQHNVVGLTWARREGAVRSVRPRFLRRIEDLLQTHVRGATA